MFWPLLFCSDAEARPVVDKHDARSVAGSTLSSGTIVSDLNSSEMAVPIQTENLPNLNNEPLPGMIHDPPPPSPYTLKNKKFSIGSADSFYDEPYSNLEEIDAGVTPVPPPTTSATSAAIRGAGPEEAAYMTSFTKQPLGVMDKTEDEAVVMEVKDIENVLEAEETENKIHDFDEVLNSLLFNESPTEPTDKTSAFTTSDGFDSMVMLF